MTTNREPSIIVTRDDYKALSRLAERRPGAAVADYLAYELDRARIVLGADQAPGVVRIWSRVCFRDLEKDVVRDVVLVMPHEADIGKGCVSVLTPVGVALLGLSAGQAISFTAPNGQERSLQVIKVKPPGERQTNSLQSPRASQSESSTTNSVVTVAN
jgi:regulator of nucleoside diphosphate kinase